MKKVKNKKSRTVFLSQKLVSETELAIEQYNQSLSLSNKCINLDTALFFVNLVIEQSRKQKDDSTLPDGYARLYSPYLQNVKNDSAQYFQVLTSNNILLKINYSTLTGKSNAYKVNDRFLEDKPVIVKIEPKLRPWYYKGFEDRKKKAEKSSPHLIKWLNEMEIDHIKAYEAMSKKEYTPNERIHRLSVIENIKEGNIIYFRDGKDNRLHSNLTSCAKDIRKYLQYQNEPIVFVDIKNSQPFFLASILAKITNHIDYTTLSKRIIKLYEEGIISRKISQYSTMLVESNQHTDNQTHSNLKFIKSKFINEVLDGTFYTKYGDLLTTGKCTENKKPIIKFRDGKYLMTSYLGNDSYGKPQTKTTELETVRDVGKKATYILFFSSNKNPIGNAIFRENYPDAYKFIRLLKEHNINISTILQNLEAEVVLDNVTKSINRWYPHIPLFTIHDSIGTTPLYVETVERIMKEQITKLVGVNPQVEVEWPSSLTRVA